MDQHNRTLQGFRHADTCPDCKQRIQRSYGGSANYTARGLWQYCDKARQDRQIYLLDKRQIDKMEERNSYWSLTLFNDEWKKFQHPTWTLEGQEELCPETGKLHYQGMLHTGQVRWSAVKKVFPQAHIEPARDPVALQKYVHKTATRAPSAKASRVMNRDKFFADVFEFAYDTDADHLEEDVKADKNCTFLMEIVENMLDSGGDWSYSYMAINPQTKQLWQRFRSVYYKSWRHDHEIMLSGGMTNADDNESVEQDASGTVGEEHQQAEIEVCVSESEEDSVGEDDSNSQQDTEDGDSESDQGSGGD